MNSGDIIGWELLFRTIEPQISDAADILIALTHFVLIKSKFRCIGVGEDKTYSEYEQSTELLPPGWNDLPCKYALRYVNDKKLYLFLAAKSEHVLIMNLLDVKTGNVSNIGLIPKETIKALKGSLATVIPTASTIMDRLRKELIDPVFAGTSRGMTTQTVVRNLETQAEDAFGFSFPYASASDPFPRGIGRGDLDPLGRAGAGNLAVLPQIGPRRRDERFDPFGPGPGVRSNPNNDEFQPPGFGDFREYM